MLSPYRVIFLTIIAMVALACLQCGELDGYSQPVIGSDSIAAGASHTCAGGSNGLWCWGSNRYGQLGEGTTRASDIPIAVLNLTDDVIEVAAGNYHTCALLINGAVQCWGRNNKGQLGNSTITNYKTPQQVLGLTSGVTSISAASDATCAVVSGEVQCWGDGTLRPETVSGTNGEVTAVAVGHNHKCAIVDGGAKCWGTNNYGQLGDGTTNNAAVPVEVTDLTTDVTQIALSWSHSCAVVNGSAKCWGWNGHGQLGDGSTTTRTTPITPTDLTTGVTNIACGGTHQDGGGSVSAGHTCAIVSGAMKCWGANGAGELGDNSTIRRTSPTSVIDLSSDVTAVTAGGSALANGHSCAAKDGLVYCWGLNSSGQLGNKSSADSIIPYLVSEAK